MTQFYKSIPALFLLLVLSSCGDENDPACIFDHPTCTYEPEDEKKVTAPVDTPGDTTIRITNTSRSVAINTVNIVRSCAITWSSSEGVGIGKGESRVFDVDSDTPYDVRVLYNNGTCDYQYDVIGPARVAVYRTHFSCPAPCS